MNIVFLDVKTLGSVPNLRRLEKFGNVIYYPSTGPGETLDRVRKAEIIITNKVVIDRKTIDGAENLRLICVAATGTNNVDLSYASQKGIVVKNAVDYSTNSVAQSTFCNLLSFIHNPAYYDQYVKSGRYSQNDIFTHIHHNYWELAGKTFGIIGLGRIGRQVATIAKTFGCKVIYFSTSGSNDDPEFRRVDFQTLLEESDVISIHAPLNENTKGLIGKNQFASMKKEAVLINMGRGGIIDEKELATALDGNQIGGAVLDVFEKEPIDPENPLLKVKNRSKLLFTPHTAWASLEARKKLVDIICSHLESFSNANH